MCAQAPEQLFLKPGMTLTSKADVYSFGIVLWEVCSHPSHPLTDSHLGRVITLSLVLFPKCHGMNSLGTCRCLHVTTVRDSPTCILMLPCLAAQRCLSVNPASSDML